MTRPESDSWHFSIDRGGTFTDVIGRDPEGRPHRLKLLSDAPERYDDAALEAIERMLGEPLESAAARIGTVRMGTTVATNALLERRGDPTALVITAGFADALEIGYQSRPDLFALRIERPPELYAAVLEAHERVGADGEVVRQLDEGTLVRGLEGLYERGIRSVAIAFVHGYRYPSHELRAEALARSVGFEQISLSHRVSPLRKIVLRGRTTVLDAYLSPVLERYLERLRASLPGVRLAFMQSSGGLVDAERFAAKDSLLSGPAGGVVGMAAVAREIGCDRVVGFDMGGTSTDVSIYDRGFERVDELEVAGISLRVPTMAIHTVAAGGGSLISYAQGRLTVGPESAGADPGPASYRRGGGLTVTDANLHLGRLQTDLFPAVFGAEGDEPLDADVVEKRFEELRRTVAEGGAESPSTEELAVGALEITVARMAAAIERISIGRGLDVTEFTLCSFGGAGGQHACAVADALGIEAIVVPPAAGLLSAYGIGIAERRVRRELAVEEELSAGLVDQLEPTVVELDAAVRDTLAREEPTESPRVERTASLRYVGSDTTLPVAWGPVEAMRGALAEAHRRLFGFVDPGAAVTVESVVVEAVGARPAQEEPAPGATHPVEIPEAGRERDERPVWFGRECAETPFIERAGLSEGEMVVGPAIVVEEHATTVVEPGWSLRLDGRGNLRLERQSALRRVRVTDIERADPILLEVFNHRFMEIAEQMGAVLEKTAHSVNIKERLDFSCALFDARGGLVANAPHMPVHLGSMGESVRAVMARSGPIAPGDVFALNDPFAGGTHLPDITVVTPVFLESADPADAPTFWVASRGHHADVGGMLPGSMPPDSRTIHEEGVVLRDLKIAADGMFREEAVRRALSTGPWPARSIEQNLADLKAQIAANERGQRGLAEAVSHFGRAAVVRYMEHVQSHAEEAVRRAIVGLDEGAFEAEFDHGQRIRVAVSIDRERRAARIDFTGTSRQSRNNFNAPLAVCRAAVLYVFRTLVASDLPLNSGCLRPLEIVVAEGSMLRPRSPAAVAAGNVETSQCVTDALYGALGVLASAQGTMNNLTFGDEVHQYYETICGGAGAGPGFDGASAVHTHMTNSRLTDPEVLERRYPVRLESFAIRHGSGGEGRHRGGDGAVRKLRFLAPMTVSILANRRRVPPFGLAGGAAGARGVNRVERASGRVETLGSTATISVRPGDLFVVETPGGGGYGAPE